MQETREFHDDTMKTKQLLNNSEDTKEFWLEL
jgi:hypothetical protein